VTPHSTPIDERIAAVFKRLESILTYVVALFLIGFAVLALWDTLQGASTSLFGAHASSTRAIVDGIDSTFLTIILLELLHTTLSRGPISRQLQEFLVIGITSAVRHSLELAAGSTGARSGSPRDLVIDLTINAAGALLLVICLWLVRQQLRPPRDGGADGLAGLS